MQPSAGTVTGLMGAYPLHLLLRELDARGIQTDDLLGREGIDLRADPPPLSLSWVRGLTCLRLMARAAGDPGLGLAAGQRAEITDFDMAGLLLRSSPDVGTAKTSFERYRPAWDPLDEVTIRESDSLFTVAMVFPGSPPRLLADCVLSANARLTSGIVSSAVPVDVRFTHRKPADTTKYREVFGVEPCFGCAEASISFPAAMTLQPMVHADDKVAGVVEQAVRAMPSVIAATAPADLATRVRAAILQELGSGSVGFAVIARRLQDGERSLRRKLQQAGSSYAELLDETRKELALHLIADDTARSGQELAGLLGLADSATLSRAFKRWTGVSMSQYRRDVGAR